MIWYWYIERTCEILLDVDKVTKLALSLSRQKASGYVLHSEVYTSSGGSGFHVRSEINNEIHIGGTKFNPHHKDWPRLKDVLRWRFLDDPYRAQMGVLRGIAFGHAPLLISRHRWAREPDYTCTCKSKKYHIQGSCPVAVSLRGDNWSPSLLGTKPEPIDPDLISLGIYS